MRMVLFLICVITSRLPAEEVSAFLTRWSAAEAAAGDFAVKFVQEVSSPALSKPVSAPGMLWKFSDGSFRWEVGQPVKTMILRQGTDMRLWDAGTEKWRVLEPTDRRFRSWLPLLAGKGPDITALQTEFELSLASDLLTLKPRAGMAKRYVDRIELRFSKDEPQLRELAVLQADGGSTRMRFQPRTAVAPSDRERVLGVTPPKSLPQ
jgi:outer membrane lipoprotein-sorting protein